MTPKRNLRWISRLTIGPSSRFLPVLLLISISTTESSRAGVAALVTGPDTEHLELRVVSTVDGSTQSVMSGLSLRSLSLAGYSGQDAWRRSRPRVRELFPGATMIALPDAARGRVLHYRSGGNFGFVRVDQVGGMQMLMERPGLGVGGTIDPFDPTLGASRDGRWLAISIRVQPSLGVVTGEVWAVDLEGATPKVKLLGKGEALDVDGESLTFAEDRLYCVSGARLLQTKFDPPGSGFQEVVLPPSAGATPTFVVPQLVVSEEANRLAVMAGGSDVEKDVYVVNPKAGTVSNLTQSPTNLMAPYSTLSDVGAPYAALSDDGSQLAWQARIGWEHELYVADLSVGGGNKQHVTKAPEFEAYIDTVSGILGSGARMMFVAGSSYAGAFDVYTTNFKDVEDKGPIVNLTGTSGQSVPPFTSTNPSKMTVTSRVVLGNGMLLTDDQTEFGTGHHLWWVDDMEDAEEFAAGLTATPDFAPRVHGGRFGMMRTDVGTSSTLYLVDQHKNATNILSAVLTLPATIPVRAFGVNESGTAIALSVHFAGLLLTAQVPLVAGLPLTIAPPTQATDVLGLSITADDRVLWTQIDANGSFSARGMNAITGSSFVAAQAPMAHWLD